MTRTYSMQRVANFVRRWPWIVNMARIIWRIRQAKFSAGVVGVVFNERGHVLLVEHVFHPYHPWGLPGGWVDRREDPSYTIQREMQEELELHVDVGPILIVSVDNNESHIDIAYMCYARSNIGSLSHELLDFRWIPIAELPRLHNFHNRAIQRALELVS